MLRRNLFVKVLVFTNLIAIFFLTIISAHYEIPRKILVKLGIIVVNINTDYLANPSYGVMNSLFSEYRQKKFRVVMLGDSITAGTAWNELLGIPDIANRGIGGDTTEGFYNRLRNISLMEPELCFIMGGINDIFKGISVETITENMEKIIEELLLNEITPIIQSTLYVSDKLPDWEKVNENVAKLNEAIKINCAKNNVLFLDINKTLSENGSLKNEYTYDGIHLSGSAYKEWGEMISHIIEATRNKSQKSTLSTCAGINAGDNFSKDMVFYEGMTTAIVRNAFTP